MDGHKSQLRVVHTADLNGMYANDDQIGGLNALGEYLNKLESSPLFLDAGNFLNPQKSLEENLKFAKDLVKKGVQIVSLGKSEMSFSAADLSYIISESGLKVIGNNLESKGLIVGKTYYTKAIVKFGKYRLGILPTQDLTLSALNRKGLEMKILDQCDTLIGLGGLPTNFSNSKISSLGAKEHEIKHYLLNASDKIGVGSQIILSSSGKEIWISNPSEKAKLVSSFAYSMDKDYQINNISNLSFVPGNIPRVKMFAILSGNYSTNQV
ncbi:hypothetical protein GCM10026987_07280 [Belliella aquatica]|uniref:Uncharacterized protein n=2 Tax=Belliella aquatica TaxID=1323734 RepID=A0ABQ1N1P7_9BACT|nr:hypothetical protein GCM10010993_29720 [Belliella aquatica]